MLSLLFAAALTCPYNQQPCDSRALPPPPPPAYGPAPGYYDDQARGYEERNRDSRAQGDRYEGGPDYRGPDYRGADRYAGQPVTREQALPGGGSIRETWGPNGYTRETWGDNQRHEVRSYRDEQDWRDQDSRNQDRRDYDQRDYRDQGPPPPPPGVYDRYGQRYEGNYSAYGQDYGSSADYGYGPQYAPGYDSRYVYNPACNCYCLPDQVVGQATPAPVERETVDLKGWGLVGGVAPFGDYYGGGGGGGGGGSGSP
jgi:hypothetical protein